MTNAQAVVPRLLALGRRQLEAMEVHLAELEGVVRPIFADERQPLSIDERYLIMRLGHAIHAASFENIGLLFDLNTRTDLDDDLRTQVTSLDEAFDAISKRWHEVMAALDGILFEGKRPF